MASYNISILTIYQPFQVSGLWQLHNYDNLKDEDDLKSKDNLTYEDNLKQAGAELGQAQLQLELGFTLLLVCCIILMITNYHCISLSTISL